MQLLLQLSYALYDGSGEAKYQVIGEFEADDDNVWAQTFLGTVVIKREDIKMALFLPDDYDRWSIQETHPHVMFIN